MRWLKRDRWKVGIAFAGMLLLLALWMWLMVLVMLAPVSAAGTYERTSGFAGPGTVTLQTPSTADLTVTAVVQDQLKQQDEKARRDNSFPWTILNAIGGSILLAAAAIVSTIIGFSQWRGNRNDERKKEIIAQDKELKDREDERQKEVAAQEKESKDRQVAQDKELRAEAEKRFQVAVTALGDEKEGTQIGGAVLLRSFLNPGDEKIYGRYYTQIFDLAVAYLSISNISRPAEDPDGLPPSEVDTNASFPLTPPLPLTPLRIALVVVFKESFPLARKRFGQQMEHLLVGQFLDASHIRIDGAFLAASNLHHIWMLKASLREADLMGTNLSHAFLHETNLSLAGLGMANLSEASLKFANLSGAFLMKANLSGADLSHADLSDANLNGAILRGVSGLEKVKSLDRTDLRGVKGLTKEQLEACKAKGAIIDEDITTDSSQPAIAPSEPSQGNNTQVSSTAPAQVNAPPPSTDGSSNTSSQPGAES